MTTKADAFNFLTSVIRPTLKRIDAWSNAAEELLLGTALVESDLTYRRQLGGGPALGLFQMEPATHQDIWINFLKYHPALAQAITGLKSSPTAKALAELETNDKYACAMARAQYLRKRPPIPAAGDTKAMAEYWKQHYNTTLGSGSPGSYVAAWRKIMGSY